MIERLVARRMQIEQVDTLQDYFSVKPRGLNNSVQVLPPRDWQKRSERLVLNRFQQVATRVPAYKHFLKRHEIDYRRIATIADYKAVPFTDKKNYIDQYSFKDRMLDGKIENSFIINASSGSTGVPYYWPGGIADVVRGAIVKEFIYSKAFGVDKKKTLLIICFGMGTWVAGSFTFLTSQLISLKGYPLTIITPGFNKSETLKILTSLAPTFEQVILAGIPTFLKDLVEDWQKSKTKKVRSIKFLFAGEGFSENWREYVLSVVGSKNALTDSVSILGSADASLMGFETPVSILIRKLATRDEKLRTALFHSERVPALHAYLPTARYFEAVDGELLVSADRGVPLIRYNMHDHGGILHFDELMLRFRDAGYDLHQEIKAHHLDTSLPKLPLVYTFGRGKFVATIYAANIYPENIREVLAEPSIRAKVTGKFTLETKYTAKQDHYLQVNVELAPGLVPVKAIKEKIGGVFFSRVPTLNSEYKRIVEEYGTKAKPIIKLYSYGDKNMFPAGAIKKTG